MSEQPRNTLPLADETVHITKLTCFGYGHRVGYNVQCTFDGFEIAKFDDFWELDEMLVSAGYMKPDYLRGRIIEMPNIEATLVQTGNQYRIGSIRKLDNTGYVTRDEVLEAQRVKREARQQRRAAVQGLSVIERFHYAKGGMKAVEAHRKAKEIGWA